MHKIIKDTPWATLDPFLFSLFLYLARLTCYR